MKIYEFIDKMNKFQRIFLEFLEYDENIEEKYFNLIQLLQDQNIKNNHEDFKSFFSIILNITNNHHRTTVFFDKIEKIFQNLFKDRANIEFFYR